jgi:hypothetical protein
MRAVYHQPSILSHLAQAGNRWSSVPLIAGPVAGIESMSQSAGKLPGSWAPPDDMALHETAALLFQRPSPVSPSTEHGKRRRSFRSFIVQQPLSSAPPALLTEKPYAKQYFMSNKLAILAAGLQKQ